MSSKAYSIISYITWIGWFISLVGRNKEDALVKHHLNQALVLNIAFTIVNILSRFGGLVATVAGIVDLALFVLWVIAIVRAAKESTEPLPVIGGFQLLK